MLHIYKINGHRVALDTVGKKAYPISALAMKMLEGITSPMSPDCPSSLRYSMAKYDSQDLAAAYAELYDLYTKGLLFGQAMDEEPARERFSTMTIKSKEDKAALRSFVDSGKTRIHVTVHVLSAEETALLAEEYRSYVEIRFFYDGPKDKITPDVRTQLNDAGCYVRADGDFPSAVLALADDGFKFISADLPPDAKAVARLAKEMEKRAKDGAGFRFAAFDTVAEIPERVTPDAHCADCWAKSICGGRFTGVPELCDAERTVIECAFIPENAD